MAKDAGRPLSAHLDQMSLATELRQTLRQTLFSSGLRVSPRRVNQVGQGMAAAFLQFLEAEDEEAARAYGRHLAAEGLGHRAILTTTETLRRACWESVDPAALPSVAGRYVNVLLEVYVAGREASLLQQQEHVRRALQRTQEQQDR